MKRRVALLVPEYRTAAAPGGGVATSADFLWRAIEGAADMTPHLVSVTTSRHDVNSRRLLAPRTWARASLRSERRVGAAAVDQFGANWVELETQRYKPRRELTQHLNSFDLVQIVSGSPALAHVAQDVRVPVCLSPATLVEWERQQLLSQVHGIGGWARKTMTRRVAALDATAVELPDWIFVINRALEQHILDRGVRAVSLAPPGVDADVFQPVEVRSDPCRPFILCAGRMDDPRKNVAELLRAFADLKSRHAVPHKLVLAGRTPPQTRDNSLIEQLSLGDDVEVRSPVSQAELVELYQQCSCFVLASAEEGFGLVVLEAMSCGAPVVVAQTDGSDLLLDDPATGVTVRQGLGLAGRLSDAVAEVLSDPGRAHSLGAAARALVLERYTLAQAGRRYVDVYRRLLEEAG